METENDSHAIHMTSAIPRGSLTSVTDAVGDDPGLFGRGGGCESGGHGGQRGRVLHGHVLHWDAGIALGLHVWNGKEKGRMFFVNKVKGTVLASSYPSSLISTVSL